MTYTEIMQSPGKRINTSVYYTIDGITTTYDHDDVIYAKPYFNAKLIGTVMKGLEVELPEELPVNTAIYFKNVASYGTYTAQKIYGPYYLKESTYNADSRTYTNELYDEFLNSMVDYQPITINYPTTVFGFFEQLITELGYTTNIESLPNGLKVIASDIYEGINYTYRSVLEDIAQATASLFYIDGNEIKLAELGTTAITIDDDILEDQNIELGQHFGPINTIVLSRSGDSDSIYYPTTLPENPKELKISDNQVMNGNDREEWIQAIYNVLNGIEFDIFDLSLVGYGGFEVLQKINISTIKDGTTLTYSSYVFNNEEVYDQGHSESIYTPLPEETETQYKAASPTDKMINQAYIIVNKQEQRIDAVVSEVDENRTNISNITATAESISSEVASQTSIINEMGKTISQIDSVIQEQTSNAITTWFEEKGIQGTLDDLQQAIDSNDEDIDTIKAYYQVGIITDSSSPYYGESYVELGADTNQTKIRILPERIQFLTNGEETAYISNNSLYINESTILTRQQIGHWVTVEDDLNNLNTYWVD